jgi:hypothetical protein
MHIKYEDFVTETSRTLDFTRDFLNEQSRGESLLDDFLGLSASKQNASVKDLDGIRGAIEYYTRLETKR